MYQVQVLYTGYSKTNPDGSMSANGTSTLVTGSEVCLIVDTLSPWDRDLLIERLSDFGLKPNDITHVVCTHGHPDHIGNNNLFTSAVLHIVGHSIYNQDRYFDHPFADGKEFGIDKHDLYVMPTPGHTLDSVSVLVNTNKGYVCIAGDLFENEQDVSNSRIWKEAGTENECLQIKHRHKVALISEFIIPGHGPMFRVTKDMKLQAEKYRN